MSSDCQSLGRSSSGGGGTHEPICTRATRLCWVEFGASLLSLTIGLVCVMVGAANDNSAVSATSGVGSGAKAATYLGVALLIAGALLMLGFGLHFRLVKQRLDRDRLMRCARLGIRPTSRYSTVPELPDEPAVVVPLPPLTTVGSAAFVPTGSGFYNNLGFINSSDERTDVGDTRPPAGFGASCSFSSASTSGIGSGSPASSSGSGTSGSVAQLSAHELRQQPPPPQRKPPQHSSMFAPYGYRSSQI